MDERSERSYRNDLPFVYRNYRHQLLETYDNWLGQYDLLAGRFGITNTDRNTFPQLLEKITLARAKNRSSGNPFKVAVITGPHSSGKSLIKEYLRQEGLATIIDYMTRPPRPNEISGQEYNFVSDDQLEQMHTQGDLFYVNLHNYTAKEPPYRSGFPRDLFKQFLSGVKPFFLTKTLPGWRQLYECLRGEGMSETEIHSKMVVLFLMPKDPHILALRAINRTLENYKVPLFASQIPEPAKSRIEIELERALGHPELLKESAEINNLVYIINDRPARVVREVSSLLGNRVR